MDKATRDKKRGIVLSGAAAGAALGITIESGVTMGAMIGSFGAPLLGTLAGGAVGALVGILLTHASSPSPTPHVKAASPSGAHEKIAG